MTNLQKLEKLETIACKLTLHDKPLRKFFDELWDECENDLAEDFADYDRDPDDHEEEFDEQVAGLVLNTVQDLYIAFKRVN